jgi:hypothetical protein
LFIFLARPSVVDFTNINQLCATVTQLYTITTAVAIITIMVWVSVSVLLEVWLLGQ